MEHANVATRFPVIPKIKHTSVETRDYETPERARARVILVIREIVEGSCTTMSQHERCFPATVRTRERLVQLTSVARSTHSLCAPRGRLSAANSSTSR